MNNNIFFKTLLLKGEAGQSIGSIEKTATSGAVDTYTITLTDGTTSTFEVTNGSSISNISLTSSSGLVDTYTITLTDGGTTTFNVTNGEDFTVPADGVLYFEGAGVPDGYEKSDAPIANAATEISYARYQTLTDAEKTNGTIYMVYDDPTDNYVSNNGGYGIDYSLNEQPTGRKWIDGKPTYQKTVLTNLTLTTTWESVIDLINVDYLIDVKYNITRDGRRACGIFSPYDMASWYVLDNYLKFSNQGTSHASELILLDVTIEYTKTTD